MKPTQDLNLTAFSKMSILEVSDLSLEVLGLPDESGLELAGSHSDLEDTNVFLVITEFREPLSTRTR